MPKNLFDQTREAIEAGDHDKAFRLCEKLTEEGDTEEIQAIAFQNGGACLRRQGKQVEAITFLRAGIKRFPNAAGIHHNLGNALRDLGGSNRWIALHHYQKAERLGLNTEDRVFSHSLLWHDLGFPAHAYNCLQGWLQTAKAKRSNIRPDALQLLLELVTRLFEANEADPVASWCLSRLDGDGADNPINQLALAVSLCRMKRTDKAVAVYKECLDRIAASRELYGNPDFQQTLINASWNLACSFLKAGEMKAGWSLFEYGLRAPAKGPQRWQRAMTKIFSTAEVSLWRGEHLTNKKLLIIGEQAVGDTMMFLQLLPEVLEQEASVTLALQERLVPIYKRTYPDLKIFAIDGEIKQEAAGSSLLSASEFDYQIPCGSIPQHCLQKWIQRGLQEERLRADPSLVAQFREKYRSGLGKDTPLIGISWRGGGKSERIRIKSLPVEDFTKILAGTAGRFISLQYGDAESQINLWKEQGIDAVYDQEVDALNDLDTWLAQVSACDYVISVANTTVHGSGGVGIPTLCLQSRNSDWRWVDDLPRSYWYKSVETVCQDRRGSWEQAVEYAIQWVANNQRHESSVIPISYNILTFDHSLDITENAN